MTIRVAYDVTCLLAEAKNSDRKSGIYRVTEEVMNELNKRDDIELSLIKLCAGHPLFNALEFSCYLKNEPYLTNYKTVEILKSRLNLRSLYDEIYPIFLSKEFQELPKFLPKAFALGASRTRLLAIRGIFKFLRMFDAYIDFDKNNFDIIHSPYHKLPSEEFTQGIPRLITVHDIIPVVIPEMVAPVLISYFKEILSSINHERDWVVCNSEYTKQEFCEYTGMPLERTFVTPLAAAHHFHPVTDATQIATTRQRYGIPDGDYFLSVGTQLEPRKNLTHLIRCFLRLLSEQPNLNIHLVLVGSKRFQFDETIARLFPQLTSRVVFTGYVADEDLSAIYSGATAFIYPSLYEGFGLPTLEAMRCGTPVIASNTTSLPEVVGDAGILVDPKDEDALCQAMLDLLSDSQLVRELRQKGFARSQNFSWSKCASDTVAVYKQIVNY
ncbi:glycosyltransferase family 4 protein [Scytonema sp. NUACC26]|uniref:glycosyltransferase family 4 protein n=1 Tax=Scytonema sp. NUACC26 TaxID=3140176 RepID=UPI0034DC9CBE